MTAQPHIIVLAGGGYAFRSDHEGEPVAEWLRSLGLDASVFDYPVLTRHPGPIDAVRMRVAELRAAGVERLGILGFSAGGHLAGHSAALGLVDAAVLCYPVVSMMTPTHGGSRRELLGRWATRRARATTSVERLVTPSMPPTFVWHTAEDDTVPLEHPYLLGQALARHGVPHALHVYPRGHHGLGLVAGVEGGEHAGIAAHWTRDCAEWLRELGWVS
jgi:acetyl esterase/lipase